MKHVILVAGMDYEFKGLPFRDMCNNRVLMLLARNKSKQDMTFKIFDIGKGEIVTKEVTFTSGKRSVKESKTAPYKALSKANFVERRDSSGEKHYDFKNGQFDVMSVLDVYRAVQDIGKTAAQTLLELSFFSHGWLGGPVLVNSYDDGKVHVGPIPVFGGEFDLNVPTGSRDPDDKDPRVKDFQAGVMSAAELKLFQDAFHTDGYIWTWGCTFPRRIHTILHKMERNKAYKDKGVSDDTVFTFTDFTADELDAINGHLSLKGLPLQTNLRKVEVAFKIIKGIICDRIQLNYAFHAARAAKVKAFAAPVGTYADLDTGKLPLMSVEKGFARHFTFYKNYMGLSFDPESRHYAEYLPTYTCSL